MGVGVNANEEGVPGADTEGGVDGFEWRRAADLRLVQRELQRARGLAGALPDLDRVVLRACGLSRSKTAALKDLAAKTLDGTVPSGRALVRMSDEEIIERLTAVRGIGRWTVEMLLLFELGRLDVWPVADYGVQKGFAKTFGRRKLPTQKQFLKIGEKWRPLPLRCGVVFLARARSVRSGLQG